eukprot:767582-Hanusia_phi.AAC.3
MNPGKEAECGTAGQKRLARGERRRREVDEDGLSEIADIYEREGIRGGRRAKLARGTAWRPKGTRYLRSHGLRFSIPGGWVQGVLATRKGSKKRRGPLIRQKGGGDSLDAGGDLGNIVPKVVTRYIPLQTPVCWQRSNGGESTKTI